MKVKGTWSITLPSYWKLKGGIFSGHATEYDVITAETFFNSAGELEIHYTILNPS